MNLKCFRLLGSLALVAVALPSQSRVLALSAPIDTTLAYQYFQEAQALCSRDSGKLWGVSLCGPMLFVDRKTRTVVANQADKEGILTKSGNVFAGNRDVTIKVFPRANHTIQPAPEFLDLMVEWTVLRVRIIS